MLATPIKDPQPSTENRKPTRSSNMLPAMRSPSIHQVFLGSPLLTSSTKHNRSLFQASSVDSGLMSPFHTPSASESLWKPLSVDDDDMLFSCQSQWTPSRSIPFPNASNSCVGTGKKRKTTQQTSPRRLYNLTPPASDPQHFECLLPPPKFGTPKTRAETDASIYHQATPLTRLNLNKAGHSDNNHSGAIFTGHKAVRRRSSIRNLKEKYSEVVEVTSPDGHISKRRARSRPISQELLNSVCKTPSPVKWRSAFGFPGKTHQIRKPSDSSNNNTPSKPQLRTVGRMNAQLERPANFENRAPLSRIDSVSILFGGPPQPVRQRTNAFVSTSAKYPTVPRPQVHRSFAGTGDDIQSHSMLPSPKSSPLISLDDTNAHRAIHDEILTASQFRHVQDSSDDECSVDSNTSVDQWISQTSTSASSLYTDDELLVSHASAPVLPSGWPHTPKLALDAFILQILNSKASGVPRKAPKTPVKNAKACVRPWQSAVTRRVRRIDWELGGGGKAPRKSMPLLLPTGHRNRQSVFGLPSDSEDEQHSSHMSNYAGIGYGYPNTRVSQHTISRPTSITRRRGSSGDFSSDSGSVVVGTPTKQYEGNASSLEPLPIYPSMPRFSPTRSVSGSSTGSFLSSHSNKDSPVQSHKTSVLQTRKSRVAPQENGRFDRDFNVIGEIGNGEFGKVLKVRSKNEDEALFAIKRSKPFGGAKHRIRLREEAEVLRHLNTSGQAHPNVLMFIDSWEEDERLYIKTELCDLGSLGRFLREYGRAFPHLDEARVWKIIADLANGLLFIHTNGCIHLDIKPENIFVTSSGRFKIGDFGMASVWPRRPQGTNRSPFEREGDKLYLAPEVLLGVYGKGADVFSFGMTILETASNIVVPDQGESWHRLRQEDFSEAALEGSPVLLELIRQMMRTDPALRITIEDIQAHPVVSRARAKMEILYSAAQEEGTSLFAASPLASVAAGFLEEILGQDMCDGGTMDLDP